MSETESNTIRSGFIRQRRNLLIVSLVLLFAETAQLRIEKLNVFGNELVIGNPVVVNYALWIAFAYWFLRYLVYFHDLGDIGYHDKRKAQLSRMVSRWVSRRFSDDQAWRDQLVQTVKDNVIRSRPSDVALHHRMDAIHTWEVKNAAPIGTSSFQTIPVQVELILVDESRGTRDLLVDGFGTIDIADRPAMLLNTRAVLYVLTRTHVVTEYYLPIIVALAPLFFFFYRLAER